ncbi:MAG: Na+/H+ antiporter subunit E [Lachnospiraceae bacterium]|nr:Na+/H+ antiporter subunit E [Lachnospiraceae bacterium]MBQ5849893.1 Na+/H+ antiporter subunit E [Lachnospiraceae bacterium]MEE0918492.1 Na+/H+ antiporter subunit E [Lachnospiraceae bacterium]
MFFLLYCIWLVLNGHITMEICIFGIFICCAVFLFMVKFLGYSIAKEKKLYMSIPFLISYVAVLFVEIIKANFAVFKLMLFESRKIEPVIVKFNVPLKTRFARIVLANSITLTPGTITARITEDEYVVHCLTEELSNDIDNSSFVKMLMKWEAKMQ